MGETKAKKSLKKEVLAPSALGGDQFSLSLQQLSLPSQSVTNSHRPPRNSLSLHNHWGLAGDPLPALFGCLLLFPAWEALGLLPFSYACTPDSSVPKWTHFVALPRGIKNLLSLLSSCSRISPPHIPWITTCRKQDKAIRQHPFQLPTYLINKTDCSHPRISKYSRNTSCPKGLLWRTLRMLQKGTKNERKEKKKSALGWKAKCVKADQQSWSHQWSFRVLFKYSLMCWSRLLSPCGGRK